ncbi:hypothetical protein HanIR_Chr07g0332611 [Helianthus annuus]|nr:hypothetical protein HanIR_Chr07g0332611 [Helianthus annuus]
MIISFRNTSILKTNKRLVDLFSTYVHLQPVNTHIHLQRVNANRLKINLPQNSWLHANASFG